MSENNVKKLCGYMAECVKFQGKTNNAFNNLKSNKDNKIIITDKTTWASDDREITELMTLAQLNKNTMSLTYCDMFLIGNKSRQDYYAPILYTDAELKRDGDIIRLDYDETCMSVNIGMLSSLLCNELLEVENIINQILEINEPQKIDFISVLRGLIPEIDNMEIKKQKAIVLAKTPDNIQGLLSELKQIEQMEF